MCHRVLLWVHRCVLCIFMWSDCFFDMCAFVCLSKLMGSKQGVSGYMHLRSYERVFLRKMANTYAYGYSLSSMGDIEIVSGVARVILPWHSGNVRAMSVCV